MNKAILLLGILSKMTSTERVLEYTKLPQEKDNKPTCDRDYQRWPTDGSIRFSNLSLRYYEGGPLVLKNISVTIRGKDKV